MSEGDAGTQYVPLNKLKVYRSHVLINSVLRKLNFSNKFSLTENPGADSVDFDISASDIDAALNDLTDVVITSPTINQFLRHNGVNWGNESVTIPASINDLTDVVITTPADGQILQRVAGNWTNVTHNLDALADVVITAPASGHILQHNGTSFVNVAAGAGGATTLDELTDVAITAPSDGQIIQRVAGVWNNVTPAGVTAREDLCSVLAPCGLDNPGTSYADLQYYHITTGGSNVFTTKAIAPIDFTGKTQYKVDLNLRRPGSTDYDIRIVDDSSTSNVLHEFLAIAEGSHTTSLTALPGWATGVKTLRLQGKTGNSTDDIGIPHCLVYLK